MKILPVVRFLPPPGTCIVGVVLVGCLLITVASGAAAAAAWLPVADVEPGMVGYGLSVFQGTRIDTFGVQVIGVQRGVRAGGDLILVEVSGHDLERSAVAQGMSGSPVFIDGRFIGAVAFGWAGSLRPLAGLTPAAEMLALPVQPEPVAARLASAGPPLPDPGDQGAALRHLVVDAGYAGLAAELWPGDETRQRPGPRNGLPASWPPPRQLLESLLVSVNALTAEPAAGTQSPGLQPLRVNWLCRPLAGSGAATTSAARSPSDPDSGTRRTDDVGADRHVGDGLVPGAACAIPMILGDASLGAVGTVSWVDDQHVFMMGHPFLQRGPIALPLATADIVTVLPSRQMSFKIGSIGPVVGSVHHDQRAGLTGILGPGPDLVPVTVALEGRPGGAERYEFSVVRDAQLTPTLVFWCLYNSLLVRGDDQSRQTVRYDIRSRWRDDDGQPIAPIDMTGLIVGPNGAATLGPEWMVPLQILMNNPHAELHLESIEARLALSRPLAAARIATVTTPPSVHAGRLLPVTVTLAPIRGPEQQTTLDLTIPEYLPPGRYRLLVANARDLFGLEVERAAARFSGRNLGATLDLVRSSRSASQLVVALIAPSRGVVVDGRELSGLPGSVNKILRADGSGDVAPTKAGYVSRQHEETGLFLVGHLIKEIQLLRPAAPAREESRP